MTPGWPAGIEALLRAAAGDDAFLQALLQDREAALAARGITLSASELAVLAAISVEQLGATVLQLRQGPIAEAPPLPPPGLQPQGIRPDLPSVVRGHAALTAGIRPDRGGWLSRLFRRR